MSRNRLETYLELLGAIANKGPLKLEQLTYFEANDEALKRYVYFLIKQGLVEEQTVDLANGVFSVNQNGINVLKFFDIHKQALSIIE